MIDRTRSGEMPMSAGCRLGADTFTAQVDAGGIAIRPAGPTGFAINGDPVTLASVVYGGRPIADVEAQGALTLTGNRAAAERFVTLFPLPAKVSG